MALAIDSQMASGIGASSTGASTLTFSFNNAAGTFMLLGIGWGNSSALSVLTALYGIGSLAVVPGATVGYDGATHNFAGAALWSMLTPATGANNIAITMSGVAGGATAITAGVMTFTGNDTVTPIVASSGKSNFLESNTTSATVVSGVSTAGNLVVAQMATGSGYSSVPVGTLSWSNNASSASAGGNGAMTYASGTGGTITMTDTIVSDFFGMVCCEVAAAGGGATRGLFQTPSLGGMGIGGSFFRDPLQGQPYAKSRSHVYVPARMAA